MDKVVVLFTMKDCPYCVELKEMLVKEGIDYIDRDIEEYNEEYNLFVEITENEYVPSFILIESPETNPISELYAPDRDFDELEEGLSIIKEFFKK
jgi:glutaredoxin